MADTPNTDEVPKNIIRKAYVVPVLSADQHLELLQKLDRFILLVKKMNSGFELGAGLELALSTNKLLGLSAVWGTLKVAFMRVACTQEKLTNARELSSDFLKNKQLYLDFAELLYQRKDKPFVLEEIQKELANIGRQNMIPAEIFTQMATHYGNISKMLQDIGESTVEDRQKFVRYIFFFIGTALACIKTDFKGAANVSELDNLVYSEVYVE